MNIHNQIFDKEVNYECFNKNAFGFQSDVVKPGFSKSSQKRGY